MNHPSDNNDPAFTNTEPQYPDKGHEFWCDLAVGQRYYSKAHGGDAMHTEDGNGLIIEGEQAGIFETYSPDQQVELV